MQKLLKLEGIGSVYASKLHNIGIDFDTQLLEQCANSEGLHQIAEKSGISERLLSHWVHQADLARVNGVKEEFSDLLERAGIDSVQELAHWDTTSLHQKLSELNQKKHLVRRLPSEQMLAQWIEQAKTLPRIVQH